MSRERNMTLVLSLEHIEHQSRQERSDSEGHPSPERLAAYHAGRLSAQEDATLREHLLLCDDCPALLLDLEELFEPRFRDLDLSEAKLTAAWRDLRARLMPDSGRSTPGGSTPSIWKRLISWFSTVPRPVYAAATGLLLLATVALSVQQSLGRIQPTANTAIFALSAPVRTRSPEPVAIQAIVFPPGHDAVVLRPEIELPPEAERRHGRYEEFEARFLDPSSHVVTSVEGLRREGESNILVFTLPRRSLKPGRYELRLFGSSAGQAPAYPAGEYQVEIFHPRA